MFHVEHGRSLRDGCFLGIIGRHMAVGEVRVGDEVKELQERWNSFGLAPRLEHVMCQVEFIVLAPVVLSEEDLDGAPHGFNFVRGFPRDGIFECDGVIDGAVRVAV